MNERRFWFGLGLVGGAILTGLVADTLIRMRRARAEELRARAEAVEMEIAYLERVERLAQGNAAAAA